jgi:inhibitor of KinA
MPLGDQAVLINFEQQIEAVTHQKVIDLASQIEKAFIRGINFVSPAYCSLTVGYHPGILAYTDLINAIKKFSKLSAGNIHSDCRKVTIPVCYNEKYALDLAEVSRLSGLSRKEIIAIHGGETYRVYMLGFLPGFPYLGTLPERLQLARKENPE